MSFQKLNDFNSVKNFTIFPLSPLRIEEFFSIRAFMNVSIIGLPHNG